LSGPQDIGAIEIGGDTGTAKLENV